MLGGFLCEVNPYDEVWLELEVHIPRNWKKRKFLVYYRPQCSKVLQLPGFVCMKVS